MGCKRKNHPTGHSQTPIHHHKELPQGPPLFRLPVSVYLLLACWSAVCSFSEHWLYFTSHRHQATYREDSGNHPSTSAEHGSELQCLSAENSDLSAGYSARLNTESEQWNRRMLERILNRSFSHKNYNWFNKWTHLLSRDVFFCFVFFKTEKIMS